jgi:hypothetical protein
MDDTTSYGMLTPERLKKLLDDYGITSYFELEKMTGVPRGHISRHMRGIQPLGPRLRKRLAHVFTRAKDRKTLFYYPYEANDDEV